MTVNKFITAAAVLLLFFAFLLSGCSAQHAPGGAAAAPDSAGPARKQILGTEPGREIDLTGDGTVLYYESNSSAAGYIVGEIRQEMTGADHRTSEVKAAANLGYRFIGWSDGKTDPVRSGDTAAESRVITAIFDYEFLEMPVLSIKTETGGDVESKTEYIGAELDLYNAGGYDFSGINAGIRGRGNNTWGYPKKSYKLDLDDKMNLLGIGRGEAKKWVLLANVCDQSLLRNHIAFEFARSLDGIAFSPASVSVEVYLNGEYRGVYLLAEEISVNENRVAVSEEKINKETDIGYLIEMTFNAAEPTFTAAERLFQIHNDLSDDEGIKNRQIAYISGYIEECWAAVKSGSRREIETLVDLDSLADTYLVEEVLKNLDVGYDSFYLYKDKGGKLCFGPLWDFDLSQGNANEGCEFYTDLYASENLKFQSNQWYYTMMDFEWFRSLVLDRWNAVKDRIDALPPLVLKTARENGRSFSRNFEKWQIIGTSQNRETQYITSLGTYGEHYEYLAEWIRNRIAWIDDFIRTDDYMSGGDGSRPAYANAPSSAYGNDLTEEIMTEYSPLNGKILQDSVAGSAEGFPGEQAGNAFDAIESTKYCFACDGEAVVTFGTSESVAVSAYVFQTANDTESYPERNPDKWVLYGSDDKDAEKNNAWNIVSRSSAREAGMGGYNYVYYGVKVEDPASYSYYKIVLSSFNTLQFSEFILYG